MLEWLKTILGDAYSAETDKKVSEQIGRDFVARADFNTLNDAKKTLDGQLGERDRQLEELKKLNPEQLQAEISRLQGENTSAKQKYENDLKAAKLSYALESRLNKEGAVNTKAVRALLDDAKISLDGENLVGVDEQLKTLKEKEAWAFKQENASVPGVGGNPPPAANPGGKANLPAGTVIF